MNRTDGEISVLGVDPATAKNWATFQARPCLT
jgi:hypothetical protein